MAMPKVLSAARKRLLSRMAKLAAKASRQLASELLAREVKPGGGTAAGLAGAKCSGFVGA